MSYPLGEQPDGPETRIIGRVANMIIPVRLLDTGRVVRVHMVMTEADARAIVNMDPEQARAMGIFFESLRDHMTTFISMEG